MTSSVVVYRFGPFDFDPTRHLLLRGQKRRRLSDPQSNILHYFLTHVGLVILKETLIEVGWGGAAVSPNSLDQVISRLRSLLADERRDPKYIETIPHEGYRFKAAVEQALRERRDTAEVPLDIELAPYLEYVQGMTDLDTLDLVLIGRARCAFEGVIAKAPEYAPAHSGLAMACGLTFDSTRLDNRPDMASLQIGIRHAREARRLAPESADAWAASAFVLCLDGNERHAVAAAFKARALDQENWRHAMLTGYVSWGEPRLEAGRHVLKACPNFAIAHWLRATVFVARGASDDVQQELRLGCAAQDAQTKGWGFPAVGLHLLRGEHLATQNQLEEAATELMRELSWADSGQLYARECAANTRYALGAIRWRQQRRHEAETEFARALAIAPRHVAAAAALHGMLIGPDHHLRQGSGGQERGNYRQEIDAILGPTILLARANRHREAAQLYRDAVARMPPGSAGWHLPLEPTINPLAHLEHWGDVLAMIRRRAL